jgi:hypothetical protein
MGQEVQAMKRFWFGFLATCLLASGSHAQTVERIQFSNAGIYRFETERLENAPNSIKGYFRIVKNMQLVERTDRIPAAVGVSLGVNFDIVGQPNGTPVTIRFITRFPPPGLRDPKTGTVHQMSVNDRQFRIGDFSFRSYSFDEEWEIVPGVWSLEFWHEGKMIAAQKFEVVKSESPVQSDRGADAPADTPSR